MRRAALLVCLLSCVAGLFFAGFSTHDFVQHLDRQVHGIHCSFVPGLSTADVSGTSGCHVTLMSPYSSVLRSHVWGGIPVSLPAMGVFAFLFAFAAGIGPLSGASAAEQHASRSPDASVAQSCAGESKSGRATSSGEATVSI